MSIYGVFNHHTKMYCTYDVNYLICPKFSITLHRCHEYNPLLHLKYSEDSCNTRKRLKIKREDKNKKKTSQ